MGSFPTKPALRVAYLASAIAIIAIASAVAYQAAPRPEAHAQHQALPTYP
jgi:hypothetical protein